MRRARAGLALLASLLVAGPAAADGPPPGRSARYYAVRGATLYVETEGSGRPLLFLHGGLHHFANTYAAQRDYFAASRRVIGVDQRGHGHSPDDERPYSYREMAEDTAALIEALGVAPVDVVGHSDGADVGLRLAHDHPGLVRRLVVSGANLRSGLTPQQTEARARIPAAELAARLPPAFEAEYRAVAPPGPDRWLALVAKSQPLWLTPVVITPEELREIAIPVLVVAGDHDFTSVEGTAEIFHALPRGQLLILPATGHATFSDRPEVLNRLVQDFLDAPDPPAR